MCGLRPIDDLHCAYYFSLFVADQPGVLAAIAGALGRHDVSGPLYGAGRTPSLSAGAGGCRSTRPGRAEAHLVFVTHPALSGTCRLACTSCAAWRSVRRIGGLVRVVGP